MTGQIGEAVPAQLPPHMPAIIAKAKAEEQAAASIGHNNPPVEFQTDAQGLPVLVQPPRFIGQDAFWEMFKTVFLLSHGLTRLQSLNIDGNPMARPACDAVYSLAEQNSNLHWLIEADGQAMQQYAVIGAFVVPLVIATAQEIKARRKPKPPKQDSPPAGDAPEPDQEQGTMPKLDLVDISTIGEAQ